MKHRSLGVFIILAATLIALPRASDELLALKESFSSRMRIEVLHAFLNMHGSFEDGEEAYQSPLILLSSSEAMNEEVESGRGERMADEGVSVAESPQRFAQEDGSLRLAMIVEPELDLRPLLPEVEKIEAEALLPRITKREHRSMSELAMMVPPDALIPQLASALKNPFADADAKLTSVSVGVGVSGASYAFENVEREVEAWVEADETRRRFALTVRLKDEKGKAADAACEAKEKAEKSLRYVRTKTPVTPTPAVNVERRNLAPKPQTNNFDVQFITLGE